MKRWWVFNWVTCSSLSFFHNVSHSSSVILFLNISILKTFSTYYLSYITKYNTINHEIWYWLQIPNYIKKKKHTLFWHKNFQQFTTQCDNRQEWQGKIYSHLKKTRNTLLARGGADKSLARPTSWCRRTESIVPLERGVCSCAELQVFSCYRGWKEACQATRAISTTSRRELSFYFFPPCKARRRRKFTQFWQKH